MSRYSYQDARELSPHLECQDFDTTTGCMCEPLDQHGRDSDVYDSDVSFNDSSGYWTSLVWHIDMECLNLRQRERANCPDHALMCAHTVYTVHTARDRQRALFDDAVSRYLRSHVDGAHVGHARR